MSCLFKHRFRFPVAICFPVAISLLFLTVDSWAAGVADLFSKAATHAEVEFPGSDSLEETSSALRVAMIGNTFIHRDAEYGFTETELTRRAPWKDIRFRNLGWPGDTVTGSARIEFGPGEETSGNWQRPDRDTKGYGLVKMMRHLGREAPHIAIIGYGSNVAFDGEPGLAEFQRGLDDLLDQLAPTGTRIVLLSPPPRDTNTPIAGNLAEQNRWLARVSKHLKVTARTRQLDFIDLFTSWPADAKGFTDNGIHLNEAGYRIMGQLIADALIPTSPGWNIALSNSGDVIRQQGAQASTIVETKYGMRWTVSTQTLPSTITNTEQTLTVTGLESGTYSLDIDGRRAARGTAKQLREGLLISRGPDYQRIEQLRRAIIKKNRQYFFRYRPQNRAYIHLFRQYERGNHAAELERFTLLVREGEDKIARLKKPVERIYELVKEKDYPDHEVPGEDFVPNPKQELANFQVPAGFEINLFASDPMISKPININWDERGRMWIATSNIYPHLQPGQNATDRILVLEDIDQDGRADTSKVFADNLLVPQSVLPGDGGVYVAQSTDLLFLRDVDGDDRADEKQVLLTGFGNADVHHMIHQLTWGPDGDIYFQQSIYINSSIETPWGIETCNGSCVWRLRPETLHLTKHAIGLVNPWGFTFDHWGQSFSTDGAGGGGLSYIFPGAAYKTNDYAGRELPNLNPGRPKECGLAFLSGRHLPSDWQDTYLSNDFRANRTTRYRTHESGSGYVSDFLGDMITTKTRTYRPVDVKMGPDGAIYIVDWYNLIIDHGEVDFHHPLRDKQHGRIWRMTKKGSPLVDPPKLAGATVDELLDLLLLPEKYTRTQAKRVLRERGIQAVSASLHRWANAATRTDHDRLEALWVYQGLRQPNGPLLENCLTSADPRARAAAVRVLSDWTSALPNVMELFQRAVHDEHPQVRLEAVNGLRQIGTSQAANLAMQSVDYPIDPPLEFALFRTAHELREEWLPDFRAGRRMFGGSPQRIAFALSAVGSEASVEPLVDLVEQGQLKGEQLHDALAVLASFGNSNQKGFALERLSIAEPAGVSKVLSALVESNTDVIPESATVLRRFLDSNESSIRLLAIQLAGRWRLRSTLETLPPILRNAEAMVDERLAAANALALGLPDEAARISESIFNSAKTASVRATALVAWSKVAPQEALPKVIQHFRTTEDRESISLLADSLIAQRGIQASLATSLAEIRLNTATAQLLLERVRLSGRSDSRLVAAIRQAGNLKPLTSLTAGEITSILKDVPHGDPVRGKAIFERKDTQCAACHRIAGSGGKVGPDLSSVGTTERLGGILKSILEPTENIKQGYSSINVFLADGRMVSGIPSQRTKTHIRLRDAKDQELTIPLNDVDEVSPSKISMMPVGLTENLSKQELLDLLRYLSTLGQVEK